MSARRIAVRLSREADRDVLDILAYTQRIWGARQRATYEAALVHALDRLSQFPDAGHPRNDRFPGCRSLLVEQHVIYFHRAGPGTIEVLRILHQRQDAAAVTDPRS